MSERFYDLYLKYKTKYLNLKINQQSGGNINNFIDIVSFNILNPDFNYSLYLFKNYLDHIKKIYSNKITNKELNLIIKNLVKIERKEFELYRSSKILTIVESWIKSSQIVCLQEVNNSLVETLTKKYEKQLTSTSTRENTTPSTRKNTSISTIDDHRVIIIPESYQIVKTDKLVFDNGIKIKDCLIAHIQDLNKKELVIFNLHIHWQSQESDYIKFAKQIKNYLEINFDDSVQFIICGDFNGTINSPFMINFISEFDDKFKLDTNSIGYMDNFTSHDTKNKQQLGWIDHILSHNLVAHSPTQTTNNVEHFEIFYNVTQVIEQIVLPNNQIIKSKDYKVKKDDLKIFNSSNFISDHKPVFASFGMKA